jgi:isocitrate/isopropylmalate dehydrogenase
MRVYQVICLSRHGIGPEVMAEASRALAAVSRVHGFSVSESYVPYGADALTRFGRPFPLSSRRALLESDAVLVASRSDAALEADLDVQASIVRVRFDDQAELSVLAPLRDDAWKWTLERAFSLAGESRARIALVGVDDRWAREAAAIELRHDGFEVTRLDPASAMRELVLAPEGFDVVVCPPDLAGPAAELAASFSADRTTAWGRLSLTPPSIFGAAHGAADTLAGHGVADPSSMLLAAALMLGEGLRERSAAATLACALSLAPRNGRPPSTRDRADLVLAQLPVAAANAEFHREAACG